MKMSTLQAQIDKATPQTTVPTSAQSTVATGLRKVPAFLMGKRPLDPTTSQTTTTKTEQPPKKVKAESIPAKSATFTLDHNSNKYIPNKENSENC
jgi:hypothetical protein